MGDVTAAYGGPCLIFVDFNYIESLLNIYFIFC